LEVILTKIVFTEFHNRASDMTAFCEILRGSKQWWTLASKISRGFGPSNPRRIDAYAHLGRVSPRLYHCTRGGGFPLTGQVNVALAPTDTVRLCSSTWALGGAVQQTDRQTHHPQLY